ncbi:cupredoxin domain-containing protein [Kribbella sp. NBC_00709]|uniref:cupredoxin domain-containing protein n=1 Tax=Kribbella sp. NBC_00709 TaxID=2975972 RepID=UPI002E285AC0|nr:cupredoxin domain-containing protein [Kribbella sp. NBC_00709]
MVKLPTRRTTVTVLSLLAVLGLAGCGGGDDGTPSPSVSTTTASPTTGEPSQTPSSVSPSSVAVSTPPSSAPAADVVIDVTIAKGKVIPSGATVKAKAGQSVRINVTTDAADEVHVHGYDKELEVAPGKPGVITFTADTKGTFEIETHESGKLIAKLVVS